MNLIKRIKNLIELSKYEAGKPTDEYKVPGTEIVTLVKRPTGKAVFIPFNKVSPAEEIINGNI